MPTLFRSLPSRISTRLLNLKIPSRSSNPATSGTGTTSDAGTPTTPMSGGRTFNIRDLCLFDIDKLMADLDVSQDDRDWFREVNVAVRTYMNGPGYDASHDYEHIQRVAKEAQCLWMAERQQSWAKSIDPLVVFVAVMVHDIGDDKYVAKSPAAAAAASRDGLLHVAEPTENAQERQCNAIREFLDELDVPPAIAGPASHIASFVSFTREKRNPGEIWAQCEAYPALRIVQDADRLDGLGAVGISRACVYGGISEARRTNTILTLVKLMDDRFAYIPGMMKTKTGKKEAEKRLAYMLCYKEDLLKQADCSSVLQSISIADKDS